MAAPDRDRLEQAAEHYETGDASAELERADYDDSTTAEPMVTTSLRLPKPVMDAIRAAADARGIRPTALMREWVEQQLLEQAAGEQVISISAVLAFLTETATRTTNRQAS
jgi:ferredoxin-NADP reductase